MSPAARILLAAAAHVHGGARHLALAAPLLRGEAHPWGSPMADSLPALLARRGQAVAVLASGDPFCFGVGSTLAAHVPAAEMRCIPAPSALALACSRLGWAVQSAGVLSLCGRPIAALRPLLQPGARLLLLSADAATPGLVAEYLRRHGFGPSRLHVMEALGGPRERCRVQTADDAAPNDVDPLNLVAVELAATPEARVLPLTSGLPDDAFAHDGQITKREIRAVTLSSLAPCQGELLWDIGAGSGSVAIEWMLRHPANRAIAFEPDATRAARLAGNAADLGVPGLQVAQGRAPEALAGHATPDAVFVGGGGGRPGVLDAAWDALRSGGRLVANAVTLETVTALTAAWERRGGTLSRIAIERLEPVGRLHGFRPAMAVTQFVAVKP